MRRALAAAVIAMIALSGCGNTDAGGNADEAIAITIDGDEITPNGERIEVKTGETITLDVTSDRAGALHVHSTPEQELEFDKGETTLELSIDTPGVVDVEEHEADVVVLQLEVR
ncbi:MAG TPA: hypothetical protein VFG63_15350 [Nocardioidaceae bacterium]|nr:hypothetical protein [Nocardioidaceae bacterium]